VRTQIYQYVIHVTAYSSVYTLVLMSLDRYLAVVHPLRSVTVRTRSNALLLTAGVWLIILCSNVPVSQQHGIVEYEFGNGQLRSACINRIIYAGDTHEQVKVRCGRPIYL